MVDFKPRDVQDLKARGIAVDEAERQVRWLQTPPPAIVLDRPCRPGDGVHQLPESEHEALLATFAEAARGGRFSRFVPASGAASRMFQQLTRCLAADPDADDRAAAERFFDQLPNFAFYGDLHTAATAAGIDLETARRRRDPVLIRLLLDDDGLGFRRLPKGLIPFHQGSAPGTGRSAVEEHLRESADVVAATQNGTAEGDTAPPCRLHFTVPGTQQELCRAAFDRLAAQLLETTGARFDISFSVQSPDTDTLALDADGDPLRDADGGLVFRPGGHGALINNLRRWATAPGVDLVFIKNIDNIQPASRRSVPVRWKQLLGGYLLSLESRLLEHMAACRQASSEATRLDEALDFLTDELSATRPDDWFRWTLETRRQHLLQGLQRPLRVCGVVPNTGDPGGGPFWVRHGDGRCTPQIVETSQIDRDDPQQAAVLAAATHFNPVDIVCRLRSHEGEVFDLPSFVDPSTVFIADKTRDGRPIKALERPGLWNGAMAHWNTVFVEVPAATFAPVKAVFDLLRPEHRP